MSTQPSYRVFVHREDQLWVARIEGLPVPINNVTDVERFLDLDSEVRDFVATVVDCETDEFDLEWHYQQGDVDWTPVLEELREWTDRAAEAERKRAEARAVTITTMRRAGLSLRAIGDVLGLSHQQVGKIVGRREATGANTTHARAS